MNGYVTPRVMLVITIVLILSNLQFTLLRLWKVNMQAVAIIGKQHSSCGSGNWLGLKSCYLDMSDISLDEVHEELLLARGAMLEGRDLEAIQLFRNVSTLDPENPFAHLWLAELYHRQLDAVDAIQEYAWLNQHLPNTPYGLYPQVPLRLKLNEELDLLQKGRQSLEAGRLDQASKFLLSLLARRPDHTLASYYLFLTYQRQGEPDLAQKLVPNLVYFEYGSDERLVSWLNQALPEIADHLVDLGFWQASDIARLSSWLGWQGDVLDAQRLLHVGASRWPTDSSLEAIREELEWRSLGGGRECPPEKIGVQAYPWIVLCGNPILMTNHDRESRILGYLSQQLGIEPFRIQLGNNLLVNGDFGRQSGGSPESWSVVTSVTFDQILNRWKPDPDFFSDSGLDPMGFCGDRTSIRLQILWDRRGDRTLFSGVSQAIKLPEPGLYAVSTCYLSDDGILEVSISQTGQILAARQLPATGQGMRLDVQLLRVTQVDQPVYVAPRLYGVGRAWVSQVALQPVHILPPP
jgi:tetratricopeptide (TPR) repeat protein